MTYKVEDGYFTEVCGHPVVKRPADLHYTDWRNGGPFGIVWHYTVGCSDDIKGTLDAGHIGATFNVGRNGTIYQYAPLGTATWHAYSESHFFYGIEHTAYPGHGCELTDVQLETSAKLSAALVEWMKDKYGNTVPLEHLTSNFTAGFHDHADFADDGQNNHSDHLYRWSWGEYLAAVAAAMEGSDVTGDDIMQGSKDFRAGLPLNQNWNPARIFGWNLEKRIDNASTTPVPGSLAPHDHKVILSGTTEASS